MADPGTRSLDDPASGKHDEAMQFIALDDRQLPGAGLGDGGRAAALADATAGCIRRQSGANINLGLFGSFRLETSAGEPVLFADETGQSAAGIFGLHTGKTQARSRLAATTGRQQRRQGAGKP